MLLDPIEPRRRRPVRERPFRTGRSFRTLVRLNSRIVYQILIRQDPLLSRQYDSVTSHTVGARTNSLLPIVFQYDFKPSDCSNGSYQEGLSLMLYILHFCEFRLLFLSARFGTIQAVTPPGRFRPIVSAGIFIIGKLKCRRPFLLRNICAHHSRFWNRHMKARISRKLGLAPQLAPFVECLDRQPSFNYTTTFTVLALCAYCMGIIRPESKWKDRCHALLKTATPFILRGMGVPSDWKTLALWQ